MSARVFVTCDGCGKVHEVFGDALDPTVHGKVIRVTVDEQGRRSHHHACMNPTGGQFTGGVGGTRCLKLLFIKLANEAMFHERGTVVEVPR
jgi:hypothetical protein